MRLGPILQAIIAVPELASAASWAEATLGLALTARGRFPREIALTLGAPALIDAPCVSAGVPLAPDLLLVVEAPAVTASPMPVRGWSGLGLRRPGTSASVIGLNLCWTLSDGQAALTVATLSCAAPAVSRGYYRGLGAQASTTPAATILPLREAELVLKPVSTSELVAGGTLQALVFDRGSVSAALPAPDAHGVGPDGEWLLLRAAPIRPLSG